MNRLERELLEAYRERDAYRADLAAARRETVDVKLRLEESIAREDKRLVEAHQLRRETDEMRQRTIEEIAQFVENEPIHSWVPGILAKRIRALSAQSHPHKSMTETLMNPDEKKFWDDADQQAAGQDTGSGK